MTVFKFEEGPTQKAHSIVQTLVGCWLSRISLDEGVHLVVYGSGDDDIDAYFRLEGDFQFSRSGEEMEFPSMAPEIIRALAYTRGCKSKVNEVQVEESGALRLAFEDSSRIRCGPDEYYEAWQVHIRSATATHWIVCPPGGKTTFWTGPGEPHRPIGV
jgi:hypothetical protein